MIVTNHQLFSHAYLSQIQADPARDKAAASIAQGLRDWLPFRDSSSLQALVDSWVGPVLDFLSFHHLSAEEATHIRLLCTNRGDESPVGLCYVVSPGQDLNGTIKGKHPMAQVILALRERDLRWGVLTDGARWRLVDAQTLCCYEHYLEVDLDALAGSEDPTHLRLFYAAFHRDAFAPDQNGESGLDRLVTASQKATKAAEDHLKARVSHNEGIMAQLCMGLVRADGRDRYTEVERDAIYRDATYLLYRMLFILYAEARGLLPIDHPGYMVVSLTELVQVAYTYKRQGMPDPQAMTLWDRLKRLCTAIYESDTALGIPAYNGGLFDDADKSYLREGHIADAYLAEALFDLAYIAEGGESDQHRRIDYRNLSVRHLGSLYEGMIEYKLQIVEETLWARRDSKGNVRFLRTGEDGAPRKNDEEVNPGQVYFSQSPGERRATGTYYTPEYIVEYIVKQTVCQGLKKRRAPLEEELDGWLEEIAAMVDTGERARMQRTADQELPRFVEEQVLTFRVCDPAMGSGHFLVNSAQQITNFVVETLHLTPWVNELIDADPVAWRRRVVERCLYGVDLSLMAVELAKLSLWLASVAEAKPLSFLDHHLRQGNSLIGARLEDLAGILVEPTNAHPSRREQKQLEAGQLTMLEHPAFHQHVEAATDLLTQISVRVAETIEDVKAKEACYEQVRAELEPYRRLADLWTAWQLGMVLDKRQFLALGKRLVAEPITSMLGDQSVLTQVQLLAEEHHFFHWEIEFPELFLSESVQLSDNMAGFDGVMGNPPYVRIESVDDEIVDYLKAHYTTAYRRVDFSAAFVQLGCDLVRHDGSGGFISSLQFSMAEYGEKLRIYLVDHGLRLIVDLRQLPVFGDVLAYTGILVWEPAYSLDIGLITPKPEERSDCDSWLAGEVRRGFASASKTRLSSEDLRTEVWQLGSIGKRTLRKSLEGSGFERLGECGDAYTGVKTGLDAVFLFDEERLNQNEVESTLLRPVARSQNPGRYHLNRPTTWVLYPYRNEDGKAQLLSLSELASHYPKTYRYLLHQRVILESRRDSRKTYEGRPDWYKLMRPGNVEMFDSPKLLVPGEVRQHRFCLDEMGLAFSIARVHAITSNYNLLYVLALLNSKVLEFYLREISPQRAGGYRTYSVDYLEQAPIRHVSFDTPTNTRETLLTESKRLYSQYLSTADLGGVSFFVEHRLDQEPEQADVVHDLLIYLVQQMIDLHKERRQFENKVDLFRFVERDTPCLRLDRALGAQLRAGETVSDPSVIRHDIEGLCLGQEADGRWLLEVQAKLRDPDSDWQEHRRDRDGNFIRERLRVYHLSLDEATGRFYHYAFAHLDGFDGAGKFPGGYTRTTLEKLKATKVPRFVPVDLAPLAALQAELAEVRSMIQLTDDLIDQIVYKLYGLTEEEVAIAEGRA